MRLYTIALALASLFTGIVNAQGLVDKSADHGLMVRQIPGSESAAIDFFADLPIDSDTIYATIFRPANCPRCDGLLNGIYRKVKDVIGKPYVLIAVYPDTVAAKAYIDRYSLAADLYVFDTDEKYSDFLSFSYGTLHVGYILKINKTTGKLIVGSNADYVSEPFFKELDNYSKRKEQIRYPSDDVEYHNWHKDWNRVLSVKDTYDVEIPADEYVASEIIYQPVFYGDRMLWNDKLAMNVIELHTDGDKMVFDRVVTPDSSECSTFVRLPVRNYKKMLESGMLKNIPLQPFILSDDRYAVAYSLPEVWMVDSMTTGYRNAPCFIERSFKDKTYKNIVPLNYDFNDVFFYPNFDMTGIGDSLVVVGVQRVTWPIVYDKEEYMDKPEANPFHDEFYDVYEQPTLATYRVKDGLLDKRFGHLPAFSKRAKTGYSFSGMVFDAWNGEAVYSGAYDGRIVVAPVGSLDCEDCQKHYEAFHVDDSLFQEPDTTDYYSYNCNALAAPLLGRAVTQLKADNKNIHCLIRNIADTYERPDRENYYYVIINRETGARHTFDFPAKTGSEKRIAYGLRRMTDGSVMPYLVSASDGKWRVLTLTPAV